MEIRRIRPGDERALRSLRLRALGDTPTAFGQSLVEAEEKPPEHWVKWASSAASGPDHSTFVAIDDGLWGGIAGGFRMDDDPRQMMLYGMWVDPALRGTGISARLVGEVVGWARAAGAERVMLWVTETNARARDFYARCGFVPAEGTIPLRSHPGLTLVKMLMHLR